MSASGRAGAALIALLTDLKRRSGLSYEQLGQKAYLSRSTVHRYCTGRSIPATFAPLEAIATACEARREELAKLYRLWERADLDREAGTDAPGVDHATAVDRVGSGARSGTGPRWRRQRRTMLGSALSSVLVVVLLAVASDAAPTATPPHSASAPVLDAPMWTNAPRELEPDFVGVTANSNTGQMPSFRVGSARLWDSRTRWQNLEPVRGQYEWTTLNRLVAGAREAGLPVVMVFGGTPLWASPNGPKSVYTDDSRASPPDDLADWDRFVRTVAKKYRGRIEAYELWDMANHPDFFTGSMSELVEMTRRASRVIKDVDSKATVVCPSMGELWDPAALRTLRRFAELGGYDHCDAGAVKLSARTEAEPPETMLPLAREIEKTLHEAGAAINLWSTGSAYDVGNQRPVDPDRAADHAVRFYLSGLYAQYRRMYFYNWGSAEIPIVLQPVGGPETKAARYVERMHQWLASSRIHSCGQGRAAGLPDNLWQCRFDHGGESFLIWWTVDRRLQIPAPGATSVERLDGSRAPVEPGDVLDITGTPVLLRLR